LYEGARDSVVLPFDYPTTLTYDLRLRRSLPMRPAKNFTFPLDNDEDTNIFHTKRVWCTN